MLYLEVLSNFLEIRLLSHLLIDMMGNIDLYYSTENGMITIINDDF